VEFAPVAQARRARFLACTRLQIAPRRSILKPSARGRFFAESIDKLRANAVFQHGKEKFFSLGRSTFDEHRESNPLAVAYDRYGARLYGYLVSLLRDTQAAEDVLQEVFCKLAARGAFWGISDPEHYLFRAAHNEARRRLKSRREGNVLSMRVRHRGEAKPQDTDTHEHAEIERALAALPPEQAEVIHLKVYERMTFARIGQLLGCSANTVASRYRYACEKLRKILGGPADER
jgi:RNA polymerase sigma-70 factor (ECF subfamily)